MLSEKELMKIFNLFYNHIVEYRNDLSSEYHQFISHNRDMYHCYKNNLFSNYLNISIFF